MSNSSMNRDLPVIIVGAGIFGLSTALHLARRGYSDVTIFDKQPYHQSLYSYDHGCDGASSDINKIIRAAYGSQIEYQTLALDAIRHWEDWNTEIMEGVDLPPGMTSSDILFINTGYVAMNDKPDLSSFEQATIKNMNAAGRGDSQILLGNAEDVARADSRGFGFAVNPFNRTHNHGVLDLISGVVQADKACRFVLHKIQKLGVKTVFGSRCGEFTEFWEDTSRVKGIRTADGKQHYSALTIMACGGWTPGLVPQLDGLCETTAGSVAIFQVPKTSDLWKKLAVDQCPVWTYKMRGGEQGGLYGFPRDDHGIVKVGYRGIKYTNPQIQHDGAVRSIPTTRWTADATTKIPLRAAQRIKHVLQRFIPELVQYHTKTRLCWYTDTFDNHFVVDFVPEREGLMVVSGGSGHGFKFLPTIGRFVADRIEGITTEELKMWQWRKPEAHEHSYNTIMDGFDSPVVLGKQRLTAPDSLEADLARL